MSPLLELDQYRYSYPDGTEALRDISLTVTENESVGIVGPNGAGKTTALLAGCGLVEGEGGVRIDGETLTTGNRRRLRTEIGLVFQNPDDQLFMPTVYEDVAFGPENLGYSDTEIQQSVEEALEAVELTGYEEKSSHHLSSGEKKRVAIATVLSMSPKLLILDEPSTNLDPYSRQHLIQLLREMPISTLIAGHDLELILELCDRVAVMNAGRIVRTGIPGSVFADEAFMHDNRLEVPYSLRQAVNHFPDRY